MPKLKGFEFLKTLQSPPKVIVTTAYSEFALEGYELNVADYLLKPFGFERFLKAVNKIVNFSSKPASTSNAEKNDISKSIFLRSNKKHTQVSIDSIQYIEAVGNYAKVITTSETIMVREKISDLLVTLASDDFLQVHKSYAVSKKHINSIEGNRIFIAKYEIPIGKVYKMKADEVLDI